VIAPRAIAALLILCCVACGASAREKAIHAMTVATNVSRDKFVETDKKLQTIVLSTSTTMEQFQARITEYRTHRNEAVEKFEAVYAAIAAAAVLAEDPDLAKLYATAKALQEVLEQIDKLLPKETP